VKKWPADNERFTQAGAQSRATKQLDSEEIKKLYYGQSK